MTIDAFLSLLSGVKPGTQGRYHALCPAHGDTSPSLSVLPGKTAILVKCWSGCTVKEIAASLGLKVRDLWYGGKVDKKTAMEARNKKVQASAERRHLRMKIDKWRVAEQYVASRVGLDISAWSNTRLEEELSSLSKAYAILQTDDRYLPFYER